MVSSEFPGREPMPMEYPLFQDNLGIQANAPVAAPLGEGTAWTVAGGVWYPKWHQHGGSAFYAFRPQDAMFANQKKSAYVVCDGAGGEQDGGYDPARSASIGGRVLLKEFSDIPDGMFPEEIAVWAEGAMMRASDEIVRAGGGIATALALGVTRYRPAPSSAPVPAVVVAGRGDSRALRYPKVTHEMNTLDIARAIHEKLPDMPYLKTLFLHREQDGTVPYELFAEGPGTALTSWIGSPPEDNRDMPPIDLKICRLAPNVRQRFGMVTDGISGSPNPNLLEPEYLPHQVVQKVMEGNVPPQQGVQYLLKYSEKFDDKAGYLVDVTYTEQ